MDQHELIVLLKNLEAELGQVPTRGQFVKHVRGGEYQLQKHFGTYEKFLEAADMTSRKFKEGKVTAAVFNKRIEQHLSEYSPRQVIDQSPCPRGAYISDIHFPFENKRILEQFYRHVEKNKPDHVALVGDAFDMYSHTRFPRSHNLFTPREEQNLSRAKNEEFWREVKRAHPEAQCYQLLGNHDVRPMKRILETYPIAEDWMEQMLRQLFTFDGVRTIFDPREELFLGSILIHHGFRSKLGDHRDHNLYNSIVGHTHLAGVVYRRLWGNQTIWEMNLGFAGDPEAKGLTYTPQKITNWTPAFGATDEDGPRVILGK